ncbi:MAG: HAD family hydrolase [Chthoniobacterales bacterium]
MSLPITNHQSPITSHAATRERELPLRLLSLDFDGTMVGPWLDGKAAVSDELVRCLAALRKGGVFLAVNTGRNLALVDQGRELFPATPDFALTTEREIFRWSKEGWEPLSEWNEQCHQDHEELYSEASLLLAEIEADISNERQARSHREHGRMVGLIAQNNDEMDRIVDYLRLKCSRVANLSFQRNSIYLRFCHAVYNKGSVLKALQTHLGIQPHETFAAGDNFNDLPMLDPEIAYHLACPANSVDEVKETVRRHGGYVADQSGGDGVAEALRRICPHLA